MKWTVFAVLSLVWIGTCYFFGSMVGGTAAGAAGLVVGDRADGAGRRADDPAQPGVILVAARAMIYIPGLYSQEADVQVAKWGNSLAVRIPADVARELGIKEGDDVQLRTVDAAELAIITEQQRRKAALDRLAALAVTFPDDYKFDRDDANAR